MQRASRSLEGEAGAKGGPRSRQRREQEGLRGRSAGEGRLLGAGLGAGPVCCGASGPTPAEPSVQRSCVSAALAASSFPALLIHDQTPCHQECHLIRQGILEKPCWRFEEVGVGRR